MTVGLSPYSCEHVSTLHQALGCQGSFDYGSNPSHLLTQPYIREEDVTGCRHSNTSKWSSQPALQTHHACSDLPFRVPHKLITHAQNFLSGSHTGLTCNGMAAVTVVFLHARASVPVNISTCSSHCYMCASPRRTQGWLWK